MNRYIALLRAINVGGYRKIKMDDLKAIFRSAGFENVETYIQSGNVVFDADAAESAALSSTISENIKSQFGYDVPAIIRTPSQFAATIEAFPLKEKEGWKGYISFLTNPPEQDLSNRLETASSDIEIFKVQNGEVFSFVNKQTDLKPRFSNCFIEKQLDTPATSRNLRTVRKILSLAHA